MSDQYLWDRSGPDDEDVARLEALLGALSAPASETWRPLPLHRPPAHAPARAGWRTCVAAAALVVVSVGAAWMTQPQDGAAHEPWRVARLDGTPTLSAAPLSRHGAIPVGRWLDTDARSSAVVFVGRIGRLEV